MQLMHLPKLLCECLQILSERNVFSTTLTFTAASPPTSYPLDLSKRKRPSQLLQKPLKEQRELNLLMLLRDILSKDWREDINILPMNLLEVWSRYSRPTTHN